MARNDALANDLRRMVQAILNGEDTNGLDFASLEDEGWLPPRLFNDGWGVGFVLESDNGQTFRIIVSEVG